VFAGFNAAAGSGAAQFRMRSRLDCGSESKRNPPFCLSESSHTNSPLASMRCPPSKNEKWIMPDWVTGLMAWKPRPSLEIFNTIAWLPDAISMLRSLSAALRGDWRSTVMAAETFL